MCQSRRRPRRRRLHHPSCSASVEAAENPEPRLLGSGLRERPEAGDDETSMPPCNSRSLPMSAEEPLPALKLVPPKKQPEKDPTSTLRRGPPEDTLRRQGCRHACGDATIGPSVSDVFEDCGSPADAVGQSGGCAGDHAGASEPVDQPGDQACRDPADSIHRRGCRCPCGDATTGPSVSDCAEDGGSPDTVHRKNYGRPCDHTATGPSASNCCEDSGSPDTVHRKNFGRPCGDAATSPSVSDCAEDGGSPDTAHRKNYGRPCDHAATGPSASNCCEDSGSPDTVHRKNYGRPCDHAAIGPSASNCCEDSGSPDTVHRQNYGRPCDHAPTSPSASNYCEDSGSPDTVHRQNYGRPCGDAATGPSASGCC